MTPFISAVSRRRATIAWCCARQRTSRACGSGCACLPRGISKSSRSSSKPRAVRLAGLTCRISQGCAAGWADMPHQGRTLHATDPAGTPLEFCATMPVMPRMITKFTRHAGGSALRLDHYQILTPDVREVSEFYMAAGFRLSEYIAPAGTFDLRGVFLQRKGNPHDIVFFNGTGPRLHHFAFLAPEVHHLLHACDVAGELGFV